MVFCESVSGCLQELKRQIAAGARWGLGAVGAVCWGGVIGWLCGHVVCSFRLQHVLSSLWSYASPFYIWPPKSQNC